MFACCLFAFAGFGYYLRCLCGWLFVILGFCWFCVCFRLQVVWLVCLHFVVLLLDLRSRVRMLWRLLAGLVTWCGLVYNVGLFVLLGWLCLVNLVGVVVCLLCCLLVIDLGLLFITCLIVIWFVCCLLPFACFDLFGYL